jgi:hypothetical protein
LERERERERIGKETATTINPSSNGNLSVKLLSTLPAAAVRFVAGVILLLLSLLID